MQIYPHKINASSSIFGLHHTTNNTVVNTKLVYLGKPAENEPEAYIAW